MAYDGSLKFDTKVNTDGFEEGVSSLKGVIEKLTSAIEDLTASIMSSFENTGNAAESIGSKAEKSAQGVEEIGEAAKRAQADMEDLEKQMDGITINRHDDTEVDTDGALPEKADLGTEFQQYGDEVQKFVDDYAAGMDTAKQYTNEFKQNIESLSAQLKDMEGQGLYFGDDAYDETYMKLAKVKQALADYKKEMLSPTPDVEVPVKLDMDSFEGQKQQLKQQLADLEKQGITLGSPEYDSVYAALQRVIQAENEYKKALMGTDEGQKKAAQSANQYSQSLDKTDKSAVPLTKSILKLGNMFKLMLLRMAMRAVIDGVREGLQNLAQYSSETNASLSSLQSSLLYLKNSFATAFAPILNYVIPVLSALIDAIASALAWIAQLFAALTGSATFVKAKKTQENYAASLSKTGSAAAAAGKEAEKSTASFDKLNVVASQGSGGSGGGGGGGGATDPSDMFETVAVSSELSAMLDTLKDKWNEVASIFSKGFSFGLGDFKSRLKTITNGLSSIKQSLKEIFTDPGVQDAAKNWAESTVYNLGVVAGSVASIGLTIAANLIGGFDQYLTSAKDRIKQYLISMFDISAETGTIIANFFAAFADVFSALAGENGQTLTANIIGLFAEGFMGATELAAKWGRDILDALLTPFTANKEAFKQVFDDLLGIAAQVMGDIKDVVSDSFQKMNEVYDAHVKPMFEAFRDGLTEIQGKALEAFQTNILPALQSVADKFTEFKNSHLQPLIDKFIEFGGKVADTITVIWNNALQPFLEWAIDTFSPLIGGAIEGIGGIFTYLLETVTEVMSNILDALNGLLEFIQGVFNGDMEQALNGLKEIFKGVFNGIVTLVEKAVNGIVKGLNAISFDVPDWVPGVGGNHFGFSLGEVSLPRLATGTVVPPRAGEFAAILGDNNRETEVVSPLSTIRQAVAEAIQALGGVGGGETRIVLELDGSVVYETVVEKNKQTTGRTGVNRMIL